MKQYKGFQYSCDGEGVWFVLLDNDGSKFIVALDDSKRSGKREFKDELNNEDACRQFIDYIAENKKQA
jgi:hypothetical protein